MPLSRRYTRSRRVRKARRVARYARRRTAGTRYRRTYASRVSKRRVTKRRIIDVASTKKKDTQLLYNAANPTTNFLTLGTGSPKVFLFCPTYRTSGSAGFSQIRTASTVYQKGYREHIQVSSASNAPWKWRRIVFETKGMRPNPTDVAISDTANGFMRLWKAMTDGAFTSLKNTIFAGAEGKDWSSTYLAKLDTAKFKLHFDKTRIVRSGNDRGFEYNYHHYFPFEKTFRYDEDESGMSMETSGWSALGRAGMGDVFILDMFQDLGGDENDDLFVRSQSAHYWHER